MGFLKLDQWVLGVDTGGTYTDAVLICPTSKKVLYSAKALTTKGDLSVGVANALRAVLEQAQNDGKSDPSQGIAMLCLSTTLATNAVVEGHGGPIGVVLAGFDKAMQDRTGLDQVSGAQIAHVAGGHDFSGQARCALDEAELDAILQYWGKQPSAYAVAASFAVRNPAHEQQLRDWIQAKTGRPVSLSSALSSSLDAPRRALTAALNARLLGHIERLIEAVQSAQAQCNLHCPLMMVRGDGSLLPAAQVQSVPIETIMSGPAASLVGAAWLSGLAPEKQSFMISDMGGTTTDIAVMQAGKVQLNLEGARVGPFRTMVQAVDVTTQGLGGDTAIALNELGQLTFAQHKAIPLSLLADRHPDVVAVLEQQLQDSMIDSMHGLFVLLPFESASQVNPAQPNLSEHERQVLQTLGTHHPRPMSMRELAGSHAMQRALKKLAAAGAVHIAQITPSDAAHVLGKQNNWNARAAELGLLLACKRRDMAQAHLDLARDLAQEIINETARLSCQAVLRSALPADISINHPAFDALCRGHAQQGFVQLGAQLTLPLLAVGGPARVYYPLVGERLHTPVQFVAHAEVANAVGAAVAPLRERRHTTILGDGSGVFRLQSSFANETFHEPELALQRAKDLMQADILKAARDYGSVFAELDSEDLSWTHAEQRTMLPMARDEHDLKFLLQIQLSLEASLSLV